MPDANADHRTVESFGREWSRFDQSGLSDTERQRMWESYFCVFPWTSLPPRAEGFDLGCGSGRWALLVAPRVGVLHCIDASSSALNVTRQNLAHIPNCVYHQASVDQIPLDDESMDFGYSLGVLHHVPDTGAGIASCVAKLKKGAPFLIYLYYALENRPLWYRSLWKITDVSRRLLSASPSWILNPATAIIAAMVYFPLARTAWILERAGFKVEGMPLAAYRSRSFYTMRTDSLDRFGTPLEQRFTADQIRQMMTAAGLERITFSTEAFWCAVGFRS